MIEFIYALMGVFIILTAIMIRKQAISDFKISHYEEQLKNMGSLDYRVKNITLREIMKL